MPSTTAALAVIGAPTSAGAYAPGQEDAPRALRDAGLLERLEEAGLAVVDRGDVPRWRWRPDRERPLAQNVEAVVAGARAVAQRVTEARRAGEVALVLGGDCTVGVGAVAGAVAAGDDVAVVYLDLHPDLNTPDSVRDGALDWMGVAHLLDEDGAVAELAGLGPRRPLLEPARVVLCGHDPAHETEREREALARLGIGGPRVEHVAEDPSGAARRVLALAAGAAPSRIVHFDVDLVDFVDQPLSENLGRNDGVSLDAAMGAFEVLVTGPELVGITVTELNPHHGAEDGSTVALFAGRLAEALGRARGRPPTGRG